MEAHHTIEVVSEARHVQHHSAAEAVADGRDVVRIGRFVLFQQVVRRREPRLGNVHVRDRLLHELHRILGVVCDPAVPVHVERERGVP